MYFVTTKTADMTVAGNLPLTADEALAFIEKAKGSGLTVEVRNELGNPVSEDELRREVGR
jgi:hypothetical protein